MCSVWAL